MGVAGVAVGVLVVVLVVSGVAKALDVPGTRHAAAALGVPPPLAAPVAVLLPVAELGTAGLLVLLPRLGCAAAALLLLAFTLLTARAVRRGVRVRCSCFGRLGTGSVSGRSVARNTALLVLAVAGAAVGGPPGLPGVLLGVAAGTALLGLEAVAGRRERAAGLRALEDSLGASAPAPDFAATTLGGVRVSRDELLADGRPALLVFLSLSCSSCRRLVPSVVRWARVHGAGVRVVAVVRGGVAQTEQLFGRGADGLDVLLDDDGAVQQAFGWPATPAACLLVPGGRQVGAAATGAVAVQRLLEQALGVAPLPAEEIGLSFVPAPAGGVRLQDHEDGQGALLVQDGTSTAVELDRLGALVWSVVDGRGTVGDLVADLAEAFGTPADVVERDVLALLRQLGRAGLLDGVRPDPVVEDAAALGR